MVEATSDLTVVPDTRKYFLLASERGSPRTVQHARSSNRRNDGIALERGRQLMPAPRPSATARDCLITKVALCKM